MKYRYSVKIDGIEFGVFTKEVYAKAFESLWNKHAGEGAVAVVVDRKSMREKCPNCGVYPPDYPSSTCAGCDAYAEHQAI